jgi:hypothetical protein
MAPIVMSHSRLHIILSAFKSAELDVSRHHLFWYYSRISLLILQSYDGIMTIMTLKRVVVMKCVCIHIKTSSSPYLNDAGCHTGLVNINILLLGLFGFQIYLFLQYILFQANLPLNSPFKTLFMRNVKLPIFNLNEVN